MFDWLCFLTSSEFRKWKRLEWALKACYPDEEMKVIRAETLAELKAAALKSGYETDSDYLRRQLSLIK